MYERYIKRIIDFSVSLLALTVLSPIFLVLIVVTCLAMKGNPFFIQGRPGKSEKIFKLIKFRTMTCSKDKDGNLLPDDIRLTKYGKFLRSTSLDELPQLFNILKGDMALIGPRPQLVKDMVFMTEAQRLRHTVRPGLSGLAQIKGRNSISWEEKLSYDLEYIENITFLGDLRITFLTFLTFFKRDGISAEGTDTSVDLGDYLLDKGEVSREEYSRLVNQSKVLLNSVGD